jgi:hypothetical protein
MKIINNFFSDYLPHFKFELRIYIIIDGAGGWIISLRYRKEFICEIYTNNI